MYSVLGLLTMPNSLPLRSTQLMMPAVTLCFNKKGLTTATTHSPTCDLQQQQ